MSGENNVPILVIDSKGIKVHGQRVYSDHGELWGAISPKEPINLPSFEEAVERIEKGEASPLDRFVFEHEPATDETLFRKMLLDVLYWARGAK